MGLVNWAQTFFDLKLTRLAHLLNLCKFFWGGKEIGRELPGTMFRDKSIEIMIVFCIGIKVIFGRWTQ